MGILSGLGSIFGAVGSAISAKKQRNQQMQMFQQGLQMQQKENQLNRDWNAAQAEKANQWARENTKQAQEWFERYNDPSAQIDRMKKAGLNPDLMYGGSGAITNAPMQSADTFQSAPSSPANILGAAMQVQPTAMPATEMAANIAKTFAEVENLKADSSKKKGELDSINLDNIRKAATNGSMIELDNMQVSIAKQAMKLTDTEIEQMNQYIQNLKTANDAANQGIQESIARVRNLDANTLKSRVEASVVQPRFENECKSFRTNSTSNKERNRNNFTFSTQTQRFKRTI